MATCKTGILSPFSGQVGPVVGAVLKTLNVIRKRPNPSSKPPKQSQLDQRSKFRLAMEFVSGHGSTFRAGYQSYKGLVGPLNAAASHVLKNAITGVSPDFELDYLGIAFSKGSLPRGYELEMTAQPLATMKFTWTLDDVRADQLVERGKDRCYVVMYSEELKLSSATNGVFNRSELSLQLKSSRMFIGKTVHVWFFFASEDGQQASPSAYLGTEVILA